MAFIAGQRVRHGHFVDAKRVVHCTQNVFNNANDITSAISTSKQQRIGPRTLAPTHTLAASWVVGFVSALYSAFAAAAELATRDRQTADVHQIDGRKQSA